MKIEKGLVEEGKGHLHVQRVLTFGERVPVRKKTSCSSTEYQTSMCAFKYFAASIADQTPGLNFERQQRGRQKHPGWGKVGQLMIR